jgi:hypothetical protein
MKTDALAAALKADLLRTDGPATPSIDDCFLCGRSFVYRGPTGDDSGRFCSDRCREGYDGGRRTSEDLNPFKITKWRVIAGGNPGYRPPSTPMRRGPVGWHIACAGCHREFQSQGLRCCSPDCERRLRERAENLALMAEVGMEPKVKRQCAHPGCTATVPKWRKGRRVSDRARFCDRHSPHSRKTLRKKCELDPKEQVQTAE